MELIDREILIRDLKTSAICHANNTHEETLLYRDRNIVREQPTVEAIPKADYEARLKADMVAMLTDIQWEIEEMSGLCTEIHGDEWKEINTVHSQDVLSLIQQKINALKENTNADTNN